MTIRPSRHAPARKRFGQHFLEGPWAAKVVRAIAPEADQTFLEIGPGRGAITRLLAAEARAVVAFEIDRDLSAELRQTAPPNLRIVDGDFLDVTADQIKQHVAGAVSLRAAGNLPYNVASPMLFKLVELFAEGLPLLDASLMLQREVANRLLASPGSKDYGVLAILIGHRAKVDRLLQLPAGAFRPAPKVQSTVVRLRFHLPEPPLKDERVFAALTQAIFTRRRKTLSNALLAYPPAAATGSAGRLLEVAGLDPQRRPETLSIVEVGRLADLLSDTVRTARAVL